MYVGSSVNLRELYYVDHNKTPCIQSRIHNYLVICIGKLYVFISDYHSEGINISATSLQKQWHYPRRRRACINSNVTVISRAVVRFVVCKCRELQLWIVRRLVEYSLFFYNATDAKQARLDRDRRGLAGWPA